MTKSTKETNMNELIAAMVGRVLENRFPPVDNKPKDVILSIQHLSTKYEPHLQDITFDVHEGRYLDYTDLSEQVVQSFLRRFSESGQELRDEYILRTSL